MICNIADRAMLVRLNISTFSTTKSDKKIAKEVEEKHGARAGSGKYSKHIIDKDATQGVKGIEGSTRQEHYRRTLPWNDDGSRILTSKGYMDYADFLRKAQANFEREVEAFMTKWPQYVADARIALNGMFDPADYPDAAKVRAKFAFKWEVLPMPTAEDFRVDLGADEVRLIKASIEDRAQETIKNAQRDVWTRLHEVVQKMAERLKVYGQDKSPFRDSLVENITDLLAIVPALNLTEDPDITATCDEIKAKLTRYTPDRLRSDYFARKDTQRAADEILAKMEAFIA